MPLGKTTIVSPARSPAFGPVKSPAGQPMRSPRTLPSPGSRVGLTSPSSRIGAVSPGSMGTGGTKFPSRPTAYGHGPQFTTFDWGKSPASKKVETGGGGGGGGSVTPPITGIDPVGGAGPSEALYNDLFMRTSEAVSSKRTTRSRLHLAHHFTEADQHRANFEKRIAPKIAFALETNSSEDFGYKKKATAISQRLAHVIALDEKEGHSILLRLLPAFKDPKNQQLRDDIVNEVIPPEIAILLPEEKLLNPQYRREEAKKRKLRDSSKDETQMIKDTAQTTTMTKCPQCGESRAYQLSQKQPEAGVWASSDDTEILLSCVKCGTHFKA